MNGERCSNKKNNERERRREKEKEYTNLVVRLITVFESFLHPFFVIFMNGKHFDHTGIVFYMKLKSRRKEKRKTKEQEEERKK